MEVLLVRGVRGGGMLFVSGLLESESKMEPRRRRGADEERRERSGVPERVRPGEIGRRFNSSSFLMS